MFVKVKLFDLVGFPIYPEKYSMCAKCEKQHFAAMYRCKLCMHRCILFGFQKISILNCYASIQASLVSMHSSYVSIQACLVSMHTVLERWKFSENGFNRIF